jgi:prepilin-type N-terminal cleavage/methylation domain-containing protein
MLSCSYRCCRGLFGRRGFTLIELLIVIAIILILISIALPNFLEAQERARVARAKGNLKTMETAVLSHQLTYGFLYSDYNDPATVTRKTRNKSSPFIQLPCPISPVIARSKGGLTFIVSQDTFYAANLHCPLTTPMKFMDAAKTVDPWSDGTIPVGMDSRYEVPAGARGDSPKYILYSAYFVSGPDRIAGHWLRGSDPRGIGLVYSPTNGTRSMGDLWMVAANDATFAKREYVPLSTY